MKKILSIALLLGCFAVVAQPAKGKIMLGGGVSFLSGKYEQGTGNPDGEVSGFDLTPQVGYFLSDNIAVGLNVSFQSLTDDDGAGEFKESSTAIGPFLRWYKPTSNESFSFMAEVGFLFGSTKEEFTGSPDLKGKSLEVYISPGFTYFFNEKWALDFQLQGIQYISEDPNTDSASEGDKSSGFIIGASSLNPTLGFRYFIGG